MGILLISLLTEEETSTLTLTLAMTLITQDEAFVFMGKLALYLGDDGIVGDGALYY